MASIRRRVYKKIGGVPTLVDLVRGEQSVNLVPGAETPETLAIVPYGAQVTTQSLLNLAADLIANDKALDAEKNAINEIINEGVLKISGKSFNFSIDIPTNTITLALGKAKLHEGELGIVYTIDTPTQFVIPVVNNEDWYRRDVINIVFKDTANPNAVPYLEYVPGQENEGILPRHIFSDKYISSTKNTYPLWSILVRNNSGTLEYIEHNQAFQWAGFREVVNYIEAEGFKKTDHGYYATYTDYVTFTDQNGYPLGVDAGTSSIASIITQTMYDIEAVTGYDPTGRLSFQEPDVQFRSDLSAGDLLTFPFIFPRFINEYSSIKDVEMRTFEIALDESVTPEEGLELHIYTAKYFVDANNDGVCQISTVSVGPTETTITISKNITLFTKLTGNGIDFDSPSGSVAIGDFIYVLNGKGLYQISKITGIVANNQIKIYNLPITLDTTSKFYIYKNSTIALVGEEITQGFLAAKSLDDQVDYEDQYQVTNYDGKRYTGISNIKYEDTDDAPAKAYGNIDFTSSGFNWATTNQNFVINVNSGGDVTVTLNTNCANISAIVTAINSAFTTAGVTGVEAYNAYNGRVGIRTTVSGAAQTFTLSAGSPNALTTLGIANGVYTGLDNYKNDIKNYYDLADNTTTRIFYHMPNPPGTFTGHIKVVFNFKLRLNYNQWYFARVSVLDRNIPYGNYGIKPKVVVVDPTWASTNSNSLNGYNKVDIKTNEGEYPYVEGSEYIFQLKDDFGDITEDAPGRATLGFPIKYRLESKYLAGAAFQTPTDDDLVYVDVLNGIVSFKNSTLSEPTNLYMTYYMNSIMVGSLPTDKIPHHRPDGTVLNLQQIIEDYLSPIPATEPVKSGSTTVVYNTTPHSLDPSGSGLPYDFQPGHVIRYDLDLNTNFGWVKAKADSYKTLGEMIVIDRIDDQHFRAVQLGYIDNIGLLTTTYTPLIKDEMGAALLPNVTYYLSPSADGLLTAVRPQISQPVLYTLDDNGGYGVTKGFVIIIDNDHIYSLYEVNDTLTKQCENLQERSVALTSRVTDLIMTVDELSGRQMAYSNMYIENFANDLQTEHFFDTNTNEAELMMDGVRITGNSPARFNNYSYVPKLDIFKPGKLRPAKMYYFGEITDIYVFPNSSAYFHLSAGISRWDGIRKCYWMMFTSGFNNYPAAIMQVSDKFVNDQIHILNTWYINGVANCQWTGIDYMDNGTEQFILIVLGGTMANAAGCAAIKINSDNTISLKHRKPGDYLVHSTSPDGTTTYDYTAWYSNPESGADSSNYWIKDVSVWDSGHIGFLMVNTANAGTSPHYAYEVKINFRGRTMSGGSFGAPTLTPMSGLDWYFIHVSSHNAMFKRVDNYLWLNTNTYDQSRSRWLVRINLNTDYNATLNRFTKDSGRFRVSRAGLQLLNGGHACTGITIDGYTGDLLETSCGPTNTIVRRALKNTYLAENNIVADYGLRMLDEGGNQILPENSYCCMVEKRDNKTYLWMADSGVTANTVDVFRLCIDDYSYKHCRLSNATFSPTGLLDLTYDPITDQVVIIMHTATPTYRIYYGSLYNGTNGLVDLMSNVYNTANIIYLVGDGGSPAWGTVANPTGFVNTKALRGICWDKDNNCFWIMNYTDNKIDKMVVDLSVYTLGSKALPHAVSSDWYGIAYKNGQLYYRRYQNTDWYPDYIYVQDIERSTATSAYMTHFYQDPSWLFTTVQAGFLDFNGNDLIVWNRKSNWFHQFKTLEDPSVYQLETFIFERNLFRNHYVNAVSPIRQRYFSPNDYEEFLPVDVYGNFDPSGTQKAFLKSKRNVPDNNFMAVGYSQYGTTLRGVSILHLDQFLTTVTINGVPRYDVRNIRKWDLIPNANGFAGACNAFVCTGNSYVSSIEIINDQIFVGQVGSTGDYQPLLWINLKNGVMTSFFGSTGYRVYNGTFSERNDSKGWSGLITDGDMLLSTGTGAAYIQAFTFHKDDPTTYNLERPATFVLWTYSGYIDMLRLNWDDNNNLVPHKIFKYLNADTNIGYHTLLKNGHVLMARWDNGTTYIMNDPVWNVGGNNWRTATGVDWRTLGTFGAYCYFSPGTDVMNQQLYKTATGVWSGRLLYNTYESSDNNGVMRVGIADLSSGSWENAFYADGYTAGAMSIDYFEDEIFVGNWVRYWSAAWRNSGTFGRWRRSPNRLTGHSHAIANGGSLQFLQSGWHTLVPGYEQQYPTEGGMIYSYSTMMFSPWGVFSDVTQHQENWGTPGLIRYTPRFSIAMVSLPNQGIQMFHTRYQHDLSVHQSIDYDVNNPSEVKYTQLAELDPMLEDFKYGMKW